MICPPEPTPCEAKLKPDGFRLAVVDELLDDFAGDDAGTISTLGNSTSGVIGWKSLTGSKRTSVWIAGVTANSPLLARNSV